jgi:glycosyltransferase involved in cell wall biosynthesis
MDPVPEHTVLSAGPPVTRILLASNTAWSVYNFRRGLIAALMSRGMTVVVAAPHDDYSARLASLGCRCIDLPLDNKGTNPLRDIRTFLDFVNVLKEARPDLAMFFTIKPVIYGSLAARWLRIPVIDTITGLGSAFVSEGWLTRIVERLYRVALRWPRKVFFLNADDCARFVQRGLVQAAQSERLPGEGVDLARFSPAPYPNNGSPVLLMLGRLLREKGVCEFVEAARKVRKTLPAARFQLLGPLYAANPTAINRREMNAWVAEGAVEYLGETADVVPYVAAADCVVLPSYYLEGVPRALLEAAAMGRPVIVADNIGCRETVEDGVTGFLCKARDAGDLAGKIERLLALSREERAAMGMKGRQKMEREFSETLVVGRLLAAIDRVLEAR